MRLCIYFIMSILKDEEIQKMGIVLVYYGVGQTQWKRRPYEYANVYSGFPTRIVGYHICQDASVLTPMYFIIEKIMDTDPLFRFRFHVGTYSTIQLRV